MNLTQAIKQAKQRTGKRIAVAVKDGSFQVQSVEYRKDGTAEITNLSDFLTLPKTIEFLRSL